MATITDTRRDEAIDALTDLEEALMNAARAMDHIDDAHWRAYHQADLEGTDGGWLGGKHLIDAVREKRDELRDEVTDEDHALDAIDGVYPPAARRAAVDAMVAEGFSRYDAEAAAESDEWMREVR